MGTIRLLLALSVVLFHSGPFLLTGTSFVGGVLAVESFFLISGFYIALILDDRYRDQLGTFYWNRFVRIFPIYWVVWLLYFLAGEIEPSIDRFAALQALDPSWGTWLLMLSSNLLLFGSDWMLLFSADSEGLFFVRNLFEHPVWLFKFHYVPQAWSLPLELMFYLIAPWLLRSWPRLLIAALLSFAAKYIAVLGMGLGDPWLYRFFPFELWLFCLGAMAYRVYRGLDARIELARARWAVWLGLSTGLLFYAVDDPAAIYSVSSWRYALFLLALWLALPVLFAGFKGSQWDRWLGELSYPIYLSHLLVIGLVTQLGWSLNGDRSVLIVAGSCAVGAVLAFAVSAPLERWLKHRPGRVAGQPLPSHG